MVVRIRVGATGGTASSPKPVETASVAAETPVQSQESVPEPEMKVTSQPKAPSSAPLSTTPVSTAKSTVDSLSGPTQVSGSSRKETRVKINRMRQRIAQRLKDAQNTYAMLTTFNEIDMRFENISFKMKL